VSAPHDRLIAKPRLQAAPLGVVDQVYGTAIERAVRLAFADASLSVASGWIDGQHPLAAAELEQRLLAGFDLLDPFRGVPYGMLRPVYRAAFRAAPPGQVILDPMSLLRAAVDTACEHLAIVRLCSSGIPRRAGAATVRAAQAFFV